MIKVLKECQYINIQDLKYFERRKGKIKLEVDGLWHDANVKNISHGSICICWEGYINDS